MMSREEFERVVRAMRAEGVPLSMPNLMVRTELPRHTIQDWLDDLDKPKAKTDDAAPAKTVAGKGVDAIDQLRESIGALKDRVVKDAATRVVKEKLGLGDEPTGVRAKSRGKKARRDLRVAAGLGLVGGPIGLFYAAPLLTAGIASAIYVVAVLALMFVPLIGTAALFYVVPLVHLACAALGFAYAWRFNRVGTRSALLPS